MTRRGDEVKVGVMVLMTGTLLLVTFFLMMNYNPFQSPGDQYSIGFMFAGGLEEDAIVRFGGMKRGKVIAVQLAAQGSSAVKIVVRLQKNTPVKTDSIARIASLSALGESYIEISPGHESSPLLEPGQTIRSEETPGFSELIAKFGALSEDAKKLMADLDKNISQISENANTLLANLNEVTGPRNRQAISSVLDGANGMIANANGLITRSSPKIEAIASNLQASTEKIDGLIVNIDNAATKLNKLLENMDATITEDRPQLKQDLRVLELTLADFRKLLANTTALLDANRNDIDTTIEEIRRSAENLHEFTETIRQRPFSLIRVKALPDRQVPKK